MKHILDRILKRSEKVQTKEQKEIAIKAYEDLLQKYVGSIPKIKDIEHLFSELKYNIDDNLETHIKIQSIFELLNYMEENKISVKWQ